MKRMKQWTIAGAAALSMFLFAGLASAHVTVQPTQATQGSYQVFTVRVPSEEENVTTKTVKVTVPEGVDISRVQPKPGWKIDLEKSADDAIASITWTAEGDGLAQTEFDEFNIQGKVAADATSLSWKAYQTYSDNSVVEWTGAEGSDHPASVTTVAAAAADGSAAAGDSAADSDSGSAMQTTTLVLAIAAVVLALAALVAALSKRRKA